jgi:hypothetical protein
MTKKRTKSSGIDASRPRALPNLMGEAKAWFWDGFAKPILSPITDKLGEQAVERWAAFDWNRARDRYRERMIELYGTTQIFGQHEPVPLEVIFTDVYLLEKPQALRRFNIEALRQDPESLEKAKRRPGLMIVSQEDRLFILGGPGAGKTTFMKHLALEAAKGNLDRVPIFVTLKQWADSGLPLLDYIVDQFDSCGFPDAAPMVEHLLEDAYAMVLFDGLDEVNRDGEEEGHSRSEVITSLQGFSRKYMDAYVLITCRNAAVDYTFEGFTYVEIADFTEHQQAVFVEKWFSDSATKATGFLKEIGRDEHKGLRDLGRTPLLLALLCLNYDATMTFPPRRIELYEEAIDALLKKWDSSREIQRDQVYKEISLGRKRQLLRQIAAQAFDAGDYFIPQRDLARMIADYLATLPGHGGDALTGQDAGEAVLKAIEAQHGILVERAHQVYSFAHLTFQEYFTAKYVMTLGRQGLTRLLDHCTDQRWREVILLVASDLQNADAFFELFVDRLNWLAAESEQFIAFLVWSTRTVQNKSDHIEPFMIRNWYLNIVLNGAPARALDYNFELALALDEALSLTGKLKRIQNIDHNPDLVLDFALIHALRDSHAFVHDINRHFSLPSHSHNEFFSSFDHIHKFTIMWLPEFHNDLCRLEIPSRFDKPETWQAFANRLQALMIEYRDIGYDWDFSEEEANILVNYLYATHSNEEPEFFAQTPSRKVGNIEL